MGFDLAARLTREDRLQRLVEKICGRVNETPPSAKLLKHMPSSKLGVLVREAGYERSSRKLLDELCDRLRAAGVEISPDLLDTDNTPDTLIYFFDATRPVKGPQPARQLFKEEAQLSKVLVDEQTLPKSSDEESEASGPRKKRSHPAPDPTS